MMELHIESITAPMNEPIIAPITENSSGHSSEPAARLGEGVDEQTASQAQENIEPRISPPFPESRPDIGCWLVSGGDICFFGFGYVQDVGRQASIDVGI